MTTPAPTTYIGEDRELGVEYLLTVYPDGHHEVATRTLTVRTWSPPVALVRQGVGS